MKRVLLFFLFATAVQAQAQDKESCLQRRAAYDVGSGATTVKIADVDVCQQKIVQMIYEERALVGYKNDLVKNGGILSAEILEQGREVFKKLSAKAREFGVPAHNSAGVATAAFREALNSESYLQMIAQVYGIRLRVISQNQEAVLGYYAALSALSDEDKASVSQIVVWDIGGGSAQMVAQKQDGKFIIYNSDLASVSFKERVMKEVKKSDGATPNPLMAAGAQKSLELALNHAQENVKEEIKNEIRNADGVVFGVGSVHVNSIYWQMQKKKYSYAEILETLSKQALKTDVEIGGKYADTDATNLALVAGYMAGLSIRELRVVDVNNANGVLLDPIFW